MCGLSKLSVKRIKSVATVLNNLTQSKEESKKVWFIEIDKVFQEKSLKIFYLPFASLEKLIAKGQYGKFPDPLLYFAGITLARDNFVKPAPQVPRQLAFAKKNNAGLYISPKSK